jgi:hypothetical protein
MFNHRSPIALAGVLFGVFLAQNVSADIGDDAEKQILRLDPSEFRELPKDALEELKSRGCKVPQSFGLNTPHNVIRGSFANNAQNDWAVVCSKDGSSSILVFWGGPVRCSSEIQFGKGKDRELLQGIGYQKIGYSRAIHTIEGKRILEDHEKYGLGELPPIDHDGIVDEFLEKYDVVYYCYKDNWVRLNYEAGH